MSPTPTAGASRAARRVSGHRTAWLVALLPLLAAGALVGLLGEAERDAAPTDSLPRGADSTAAVELRERLPADDAQVAIVLWTATGGELGRERLAELTRQAQSLLDGAGEAPGGPGGGPPPLVPAEDGTAALAVVPVPSDSSSENADRVAELRERLAADAPAGTAVQVTGPAGIQADVAQVFDGANTRLLLATAGVVALLLVLTYRSPVLWLVPLTVVAVADRLAAVLATQALGALGLAWDESTVGILSVLVFGAGTDYALLLISRYRDELTSTASRHEAMARALTRTAEPVLASSLTVVLALLTLLLSLFPTTRGLGLACAIGIVVAATFALVVLPAALVVLGRWVFWPRVPRVGATARATRSPWRRVGDAVARRPVVFVLGTTAGLAVLTAGLLQVQTGLRPADQFLDTPEAITAAERLAESFPAGTTDPLQVVTGADPDEVRAALEDVDGVDSVRVTARDDGLAQLDAVPAARPGSDEARATVEAVRAAVADLPGTHVGGGDAEALDEAAASERDRWLLLPLILGLVLVALLVLLRSVVAPLVLVATVVATYAAAMGVSWWLFTGVLGFAAMDVGVPLLAFLFLVALGVDYNIFLVTRAREEAAGHGTREGMLRALTATGGVITSAGVLLAAVFAVLGVLPLVVLAQLGTVIFVGVLLDTLVVRTVLVPALALALGDRFWWPRRVGVRA